MTDNHSNKYTYFVPDINDDEEENSGTQPRSSGKGKKADPIVTSKIPNHIWLTVSEAAKMGGVQTKTIRRAIKSKQDLRYKIVQNKYKVELRSLIIFMHSSTKLKNKLYKYGLGQYINKWKSK